MADASTSASKVEHCSTLNPENPENLRSASHNAVRQKVRQSDVTPWAEAFQDFFNAAVWTVRYSVEKCFSFSRNSMEFEKGKKKENVFNNCTVHNILQYLLNNHCIMVFFLRFPYSMYLYILYHLLSYCMFLKYCYQTLT